jgi:hypothetical protein
MITDAKVSSPIQGAKEHMGKRYLSLFLVAITSLIIGLILGMFVIPLATTENGTSVGEAAPRIDRNQPQLSQPVENEATVQRAIEASAARYNGLAAFYMAANGASGQRAIEASAARYNGLAAFYMAANEITSSTLLANNPELAVARRYTAPAMENDVGQTYDIEVVRHNNFVAFQNLKADLVPVIQPIKGIAASEQEAYLLASHPELSSAQRYAALVDWRSNNFPSH